MSFSSQYPIVHPIPWQDPVQIFSLFADKTGAIFLDSAQQMPDYARYSFIGIDPFLTLSSKGKEVYLGDKTLQGNPLLILQQQLALYHLPALPDLPPFQGGVAGFFGYDLAQHLEHIPQHAIQNSAVDLWLGFYDLVIAFDHDKKSAIIFSSGYPEQDMHKRQQRAIERRDWLLQELKNIGESTPNNLPFYQSEAINSNFTQTDYQLAVKKVIDYIYAGDIFQANIAQRFSAAQQSINPFSLYLHLRQVNPAPFAAYLNADPLFLVSASPERFLRLDQNKVTTCPIKGTRPRSTDVAKDNALAEELLLSAKDRAENIMIVDLMRNDLSRVCKEHSVMVSKLCELEKFATVHHLVSAVEGELKPDKNAVDLLCATFPGGSITGAPKIRAMEIIAEIEPHARGPYCGSIGYINFNGNMDTSITIRTFVIHDSMIHFHAGGGIVADSDPEKEFDETLIKAQALRKTLTEPKV
jgi:para-aminobenzoate synthetase component 1